MSWLVDNAWYIYVLLGVVALGLLIALWATRKRELAYALGAVVVLAVVFFLLSILIVTDRKQIVGAVQDMSEGAKARNTERIFKHISDQFRLGGMDKAAFRQSVRDVLQRGGVTEVKAWGFEKVEISRPNRTASLFFTVKPEGTFPGAGFPYRCKATFVLDPDEQWRLKTFQVFNIIGNTEEPIAIPDTIPR